MAPRDVSAALYRRVSVAFSQRVARPLSQRVLSGLLAFGSCGFVACDDPAEPPVPPAPPLAATAPTAEPPRDEPPPAPPEAPDVDSEEPLLGTVELQPGFLPDPLSRVGRTTGGPVDANAWDDRCDGWIAEHPDVRLEVVRPFAELTIMAASEDDTTLVVVDPEGDARCVDDGEGSNPVLRATLPAGTHRIWVGTKEPEWAARYVLSFSELDDTSPADTLR